MVALHEGGRQVSLMFTYMQAARIGIQFSLRKTAAEIAFRLRAEEEENRRLMRVNFFG